jgi:hypothetical protein
MKYIQKSFSSRPSNKAYKDNFDRTFGKKPTRKSIQVRCNDCGMDYCDVCHEHDQPACEHGTCDDCASVCVFC